MLSPTHSFSFSAASVSRFAEFDFFEDVIYISRFHRSHPLYPRSHTSRGLHRGFLVAQAYLIQCTEPGIDKCAAVLSDIVCLMLPMSFVADTWIILLKVRVGSRSLVHHIATPGGLELFHHPDYCSISH